MKNKIWFVIILSGFLIGFLFNKQIYAYDGCGCASDGSYYCYNCDSCSNCCYSSCHFCSSNHNACCWYVVWQNNSSKCDDDPCSTNCNACDLYSYLQDTATSYGTKDVSCTAQCGNTDWDTCYCTSQCTLDSCPSQYSTSPQGQGNFVYDTCTNQCNQSRTRTCYCYQCDLASCPSRYSTSPQGYGSLTYDTCTNDCGVSRTRTCYCSQCDLASCPSEYSSTPLGYGNLIYDTCTNDCGVSRNRTCYCKQCDTGTCNPGTTSNPNGAGNLATIKSCTNNCGISNSLNCYYQCSDATCTTLESKVNWTDDNCTGNEDCRTVNRNVSVVDPNPGCITGEQKTCYIQNTRPESPTSNNDLNVNITTSEALGVNSYNYSDNIINKLVKGIKAQSDGSSVLGYSSDTHSGTRLNNPLAMSIEYSDEDGIEDMEALYVWWSTSDDSSPMTCENIDETRTVHVEEEFVLTVEYRPSTGYEPIDPIYNTNSIDLINQEDVFLGEYGVPGGDLTERRYTFKLTQIINNCTVIEIGIHKPFDPSSIITTKYGVILAEISSFTVPNRIADPAENLNGMTANNENFGFLVSKDESGNWTNIYRPHIDGETRAWVQEDEPSPNSITILGSEEKPMVEVNNINVIDTDQNTLNMNFNLVFLWDNDHERVVNAQYYIWSLANDTVGFLPFDESEDIEDSENEFWNNSGMTWNIDLDKPIKESDLVVASLEENSVTITFGVEDEYSNLARVRLDACRTAGDQETPDNLTIDSRTYNLNYCDQVDWGTLNPTTLNMENGNDILGVNPINPNSPTYEINGIDDVLEVNLGENSNGSITFYLTYMDEAGNWNQEHNIYRLGEWAAVRNAFVYGSRGVSSSTRILSQDWTDNPLIKSDYGFEYSTIDLTDQVLLGGSTVTTNFLRALEKHSDNSSFKAGFVPGVYINSPYLELMRAYEERMELIGTELNYEEVNLSTNSLSNDILSNCSLDPEFCILRKEGNLEISSNSICDGYGFIAATGDITIDPDFTNFGESSACIILANGNITIENGDNKSGSNVDYDVVEAFMIAGEEIVITADSAENGLIVEGGLAAFTPVSDKSSVYNQRKINLDFRIKYPVLAVVGNAEYGLLSNKLFGSQAFVSRIEVGYKPY